jgi:hypothetical protein
MPALSSNDREALAPYYDAIRLHKATGTEVSTAPRETMNRIIFEKTGEQTNWSCGACIAKLYDTINLFLDDFEK